MVNERTGYKIASDETGLGSFNAAIVNARLINQMRRLAGQAIAHAPSVTYSGLFTYDINGLFLLDRSLSRTVIGAISMPEGVARCFAALLVEATSVRSVLHREAMSSLCRLLLEEGVTDAQFLGVVENITRDTCNLVRKVHPITTPMGNLCFEVFVVERFVGCLDDIPWILENRCN